MNEIFDVNRFLLLVKKEFIENKKMCLLGVGAMIGTLTLAMLLMTPFALAGEGEDLFLYFPIAPIGYMLCCVAPSMAFGSMRTKGGKVGALMLPASTFEKYLSQIVVYVLCAVIAFVASVYVAEGVRYLVVPMIFGDEMSNHYVNHLAHLANISVGFDMSKGTLISNLLFSTAVYTLGAAIWSHLSFIKTYAASIGVSIAFFIVMLILGLILDFNVLDFVKEFVEQNATFCLTIGAIVCYVAAYYVLKRKNIE